MKKQKSSPTLPDLEKEALSLLKKAKYKEAIKLFKTLLQGSGEKKWQESLAYCYVHRAMEFASKEMYKEALVLWENHLQYAQTPYEAQDHYIFWLIQTGKQADIKTTLKSLSAEQLDTQLPQLAAVIGFLMLTQHAEFEEYLPQDSVLLAHFNIVKTALQAYQENDIDKLEASLKKLPYRSAFRDFRTILNAVLVLPHSIDQAQSFLNKISVHSAYLSVANVLLTCCKTGAELAHSLVSLDHQSCEWVSEIIPLNQMQSKFIQNFRRQQKLSDKVQLNIAIEYHALLGERFTLQFCQSILPRYPAGKKAFNQHFSDASEFEENKIKALACEQENNIDEAEYYWRLCLRALRHEECGDNDLKGALILRRLASKESDIEERTKLLIESLDYDANDRDSYLRIIQHYNQNPTAIKEYKLWLNKTLEHFPQDIEVLTQATMAATHNQTYKKASQYASKILKIDPLNTFAKHTLFTSHVNHARRLMGEKNYSLVDKEINQTEKFTHSKAQVQHVHLMRALLCFANEDKTTGVQHISESLNSLHSDPVNIYFQATLEALLNKLPVSTILRDLPPIKDYLLSEKELTAFSLQLKQSITDAVPPDIVNKALDKIKAPFKKSISSQKKAEELLLSLCQTFDTINSFELLRHCVKSVPYELIKPIWVYYRVYATNNGQADICTPKQIKSLHIAYERAVESEDHKTARIVENYLDCYYETNPEGEGGFLEDFLGNFINDTGDEDKEDPLEFLFGHLSTGVMMDLNATAESLMKKVTPEKLVEGFLAKIKNKESFLLALMQEPDILSALMLIKAADQLKIDIDVSIDDIIEVFDISSGNRGFPFPF